MTAVVLENDIVCFHSEDIYVCLDVCLCTFLH